MITARRHGILGCVFIQDLKMLYHVFMLMGKCDDVERTVDNYRSKLHE